MSVKYSTKEPAERPYKVDLSAAEVLALVNYHARHAKRIPKEMGKAILKEKTSLLPRAQAIKIIIDIAEEQSTAHLDRGKGLLSIIQGGAA